MVGLVAQDVELTTLTAHGELTADELLDAYATFLDAAPTRLTLMDLSRARLAPVSADSMRDIAVQVAAVGRQCKRLGRSAIVCSRDVDYGLIRMFSPLVEIRGSPVRFRVFRGSASAKAWLYGETGAE
jgi:hypothetical protein